MGSPWSTEEQKFINTILKSKSEERHRAHFDKQVQDVRERCQAELKQKLRGFLGRSNTLLTQEIINNVAKLVVEKYQRELDERGITFEIKLNFSLD